MHQAFYTIIGVLLAHAFLEAVKHSRSRMLSWLQMLAGLFWEQYQRLLGSHIPNAIRAFGVLLVTTGMIIQVALAFQSILSRVLVFANILGLGTTILGQILVSLRRRRETEIRLVDVATLASLPAHVNRLISEIEDSNHGDVLAPAVLNFVQTALEIGCAVVANRRPVNMTFMMETDSVLSVAAISPGIGEIDPSFKIPLTRDEEGTIIPEGLVGAAGFAFGSVTPVYVPDTATGIGHYMQPLANGLVRPTRLGQIWRTSESLRYSSVLSIPIFIRREGEDTPIAVLNYESARKRAFNDADIHLAKLVGGFVSIGMWAAVERLEKLGHSSQPSSSQGT